MNKIIKAPHPGSYLRDYLEEIHMSQNEFANQIGITEEQVRLILEESVSITPEIALKLSKLLGTSVEVWLNLQKNYDTYICRKKRI